MPEMPKTESQPATSQYNPLQEGGGLPAKAVQLRAGNKLWSQENPAEILLNFCL